jgi:acyl dehydratase
VEFQSAHFEDFTAGSRLHTMHRTLTEPDMLAFVQLSGLFEELWLDAGKAARVGLGPGRLVPGYQTLAFAEGLVVLAGWMRNAAGMLGLTDVEWPAPARCGDTIHAEVEVVEARSTKKPERGLVVMQHRVLNQDGVVVLRYRSTRLIRTLAGAAA